MGSTSLGFLILYILAASLLCNGARVFDVYRLLQYDKGTSHFGSRRTAIDHLAATSNVKSEKLSKYIIVIQLEELTQTPDLISKLLTRHVSGLLIVLPKDPASVDHVSWASIEKELAYTLIDIPVWFTHEDPQINELITELQAEEVSSDHQTSALIGDSYKLSVPPIEGQPIKSTEGINLQGTLHGSKPEKAPTIALVTYYDSFSIAPELARGASESASSSAALLELARLFSKLNQKSAKTQPEYNLLFLMTGAGNLNFSGTTNFINSADPRLIDSFEFVLCLDSIGSSPDLTLHVSRSPAKDATARRIYDTFSAVAQQMQIPFSIVQKKVNTTSDSFPWQHEHFSMKRLLAGTLSGLKTAPEALTRSNLFDVSASPDLLTRNTKFIAEALARVLYKLPANSSATIFEDALSVSEPYLTSWATTIGAVPRMLPFLTRDANKKGLIPGLQKEMTRFLDGVQSTTFPVSAFSHVYYDQVAASMSGYRSKHVAFDILFSVSLVIALSLFYAALKGPKQAIQSLKSTIYGTKRR